MPTDIQALRRVDKWTWLRTILDELAGAERAFIAREPDAAVRFDATSARYDEAFNPATDTAQRLLAERDRLARRVEAANVLAEAVRRYYEGGRWTSIDAGYALAAFDRDRGEG